jgi:hypothetical protein
LLQFTRSIAIQKGESNKVKMSRIKIIGPESDHREVVEILNLYFRVLQEGRLRPCAENNSNVFGYYVLGAK